MKDVLGAMDLSSRADSQPSRLGLVGHRPISTTGTDRHGTATSWEGVNRERVVPVLLRPSRKPSGVESLTVLKRLGRRIRQHWPGTRPSIRGDAYYKRAEAMAWCEANGVDYNFGLEGNSARYQVAYAAAEDLWARRVKVGTGRNHDLVSFAKLTPLAGWQ